MTMGHRAVPVPVVAAPSEVTRDQELLVVVRVVAAGLRCRGGRLHGARLPRCFSKKVSRPRVRPPRPTPALHSRHR